LDPDKAAVGIRGLHELCRKTGLPLAFDYETTTLKPDGPHARILCCALSEGTTAIGYPWTGAAVRATRELLLDTEVPKIAANLAFEERWSRRFLGLAVRGWEWDTVIAAHWLNCHRGVSSLKFQTFVRFGVADYDARVEPFRSAGDGSGNSPN